MPGYKQPCRYCEQLLPPEANYCPICGKVNPLGPLRCPKCRNPVQREWARCGNCGLVLKTACPQCGKETWFGDYCDHCDARLVAVCPRRKCNAEQPPVSENCVKCGHPLR